MPAFLTSGAERQYHWVDQVGSGPVCNIVLPWFGVSKWNYVQACAAARPDTPAPIMITRKGRLSEDIFRDKLWTLEQYNCIQAVKHLTHCLLFNLVLYDLTSHLDRFAA